MIEQKLTTYFKRFNSITPRVEFISQSRARVSFSEQLSPVRSWQVKLVESLTTGSAVALASMLLLVVIGGASYVSKNTAQVASKSGLSDMALMDEAAQITFNVQLKDAEYFDESASQVVLALDRILADNPSQ